MTAQPFAIEHFAGDELKIEPVVHAAGCADAAQKGTATVCGHRRTSHCCCQLPTRLIGSIGLTGAGGDQCLKCRFGSVEMYKLWSPA